MILFIQYYIEDLRKWIKRNRRREGGREKRKGITLRESKSFLLKKKCLYIENPIKELSKFRLLYIKPI